MRRALGAQLLEGDTWPGLNSHGFPNRRRGSKDRYELPDLHLKSVGAAQRDTRRIPLSWPANP